MTRITRMNSILIRAIRVIRGSTFSVSGDASSVPPGDQSVSMGRSAVSMDGPAGPMNGSTGASDGPTGLRGRCHGACALRSIRGAARSA